jgi:dTDP-4-dehydrorhamnose reductase
MILVFGQTGQVARELARLAPDARFLGREAADLADPAACAAAIRTLRPRVVINAAAYTAVDRAETEEALATTINGAAPGAMAGECAALGIPFVHISTDYVFDGSGEMARGPDAPVAPINAYGRSKLAGEAAVMASGARAVVLRTSWVFSAHGANFVKTMLRLGATRDELRVVDDQVGGPTAAADIAAACLTIAAALEQGAPGGIHHFAGAPDVSWAGFARAIFAEAGLATRVVPIPSSDYPTPAQRPLNSRLDCTSLAGYGVARPDWRASLAAVVKELKESA